MSETIKLKGLLIDVNNVEVKTLIIDYHKGTGYRDFESIIGSSWIGSCKRPIPFMDDVRIVFDDNGFLKTPIRPGYILHKDGEFLSIIPGNIFICEQILLDDGDWEFASLTESEIAIIKDYIVEITDADGKTQIALTIDAKDDGMIYKL